MNHFSPPIIILFFIILVLVFGFGYVFLKFLKISDVRARQIEIIGYMLLFVLIIWTFLIKNILSSDFYNNDLLIIEKLNGIFSAITNPDYETHRFWSWNESDYVKGQLLYIDIIEFLLQVSSTVCIAIGRLQELKKAN